MARREHCNNFWLPHIILLWSFFNLNSPLQQQYKLDAPFHKIHFENTTPDYTLKNSFRAQPTIHTCTYGKQKREKNVSEIVRGARCLFQCLHFVYIDSDIITHVVATHLFSNISNRSISHLNLQCWLEKFEQTVLLILAK